MTKYTNGPFDINRRRVLWVSLSGALRVESFFDGTSRMCYLVRVRDQDGIDLEHTEDLAILSAEDLAFITWKIELDARLTARWKKENDTGLPF